jgi:hypothetical protein
LTQVLRRLGCQQQVNPVCAPCIPSSPVHAPAGLGGGGVFMTGFNVPVTFGPWLDTYMGQVRGGAG